MMEFIRNCYLWIAENYKEITMTLTSAQFISVLSALVIFLRNTKSSKDNTAATKDLNKTLKTTNDMSETISALKTEIDSIKIENENLKKSISSNQSEVVDFLNMHSAKLNAMLEVQSVVYSTIKDERIRSTVNSLLVNAKYSESASRARLQAEVESLKARVAEKMADVKDIVDNTANIVTGIVDPDKLSETDDSTIVRY